MILMAHYLDDSKCTLHIFLCISSPDSFRVISTFAEETHPNYQREQTENISEWRKQWRENEDLALPDIYNRKTEVLPHEAPDYRVHKPHPGSCGFLRHNVRLLNEPVCTVFTEVTRSEQQDWWPSRISTEPLNVPPHTNDTIYRADFQEQEKTGASFGSLRHTANPNSEPALGAGRFLIFLINDQQYFRKTVYIICVVYTLIDIKNQFLQLHNFALNLIHEFLMREVLI